MLLLQPTTPEGQLNAAIFAIAHLVDEKLDVIRAALAGDGEHDLATELGNALEVWRVAGQELNRALSLRAAGIPA